MKFRPIAMVRPSKDCVYAPSRIGRTVEANIEDIADTALAIPVSFEKDGVSNPQEITTYVIRTEVQTESGKTDTWPLRYIADGE